MAWMAVVRDGVEMLAGAMDHQTQMFGTVIHEVHKVWTAVDCLSASAASSSQAAVSTMDADDNNDDNDEGGATEGDSVESKDDEDGKRVHVALVRTGRKLGESAEEEEGEESGEVHVAGLGMLAAPKPLGCITVPCPQLWLERKRSGKNKNQLVFFLYYVKNVMRMWQWHSAV
jgi:hypothetical protein